MIAHQNTEDDHVIVASDARAQSISSQSYSGRNPLKLFILKNRNETVSDEEYQSIVKNAHLIVDSVQLERDLISHQEGISERIQ